MAIATVRITHEGDALTADVVGMPVARDNEGVLVPQGLPSSFSGVQVPTTLDTGWAAKQGFEAKVRQSLVLRSIGAPAVVLVGIGDAQSADADVWRRAGAALSRAAGAKQVAALLLPLPSTIPTEEVAQAVTEGALLASYRLTSSKSEPEEASPGELVLVPVSAGGVSDEDRRAVEIGARAGEVVAGAVSWARDLSNRPPGQLTPRKFAHEALRRLEQDPGVTVEIWREVELEAERLGGLLGVSRGSLEPPRLVRATYVPEGRAEGHVVLVGKGITFDSGGLSLKSGEGMMTMKTDMTGAAVVLGALSIVARLGGRTKVTAITPLTENLPGNRAIKPGDVLTARNGTTIEVLNTDAEGRLVLADGLSLAAELEPDAIVDVATLTGAARVALGPDVAALFGTDSELVESIKACGESVGESFWELPLVESYEKHLESEVADVKNIGKTGQAGTIVAALFLRRFAKGMPWAHLDIAAANNSDVEEGYLSKGANAFSLRTLAAYLLSR
jgi:leucyl aminopeptidase